MDHKKHQSAGASSSSFTDNLFGPKDPSSSSGLFSSVFGPSSTGLARDRGSSHSNHTAGSSRKQPPDKHSTPDYKPQRGMGEKEGNPIYQNETVEPSYLSSSLYYGGQEVYSSNTQTTPHHHSVKKDGGDEDGASRGNWWQGSLYY